MRTVTRRLLLLGGTAITSLLALGLERVRAAWPKAAFDAKDLKEFEAALFPGKTIEKTDKIELRMPEIAENGGQVPVTATTSLPGGSSLTIAAEGNPRPMVARFNITPETGPVLSTRMKLAKTQTISAYVEADGKVYKASKDIRVSIGGCGG